MAITDILPVIVLYRIRLTEARSFQTLIAGGGFAHYVVYDNSPADYEQETMPREAFYVRDVDNGGLSRAYNRAAEIAEQQGYKFLLLLDQDTEFPPEATTKYATADRHQAAWCPCVKTLTAAPLSPCRRTPWGPKAVVPSTATLPLRRYVAINSGLCVSVAAFRRAGGYNERVRLDFADYQFLTRLRRVEQNLAVLPFTATQDFSAEVRDREKLQQRYSMYLESARACEFFTLGERLTHQFEVLRHTVGLTLRTHHSSFLKDYFTKWLFGKQS